MSVTLPLTQEDRNRLVEEKIGLQKQNTSLAEANQTSLVNIAEKLKNDVPFKKQTDAPHIDIYYYEEELRRLTGLSIPQPLQEQGFFLTDSVSNSRVFINDGRLIIHENSTEVINLPLIPFRGYSWSSPCGTNFDMWSADRRGSTTSKPNPSRTFTVSTAACNLKVSIDGVEAQINIGDILAIQTNEQVNGEIFSSPVNNELFITSAVGGETNFNTAFSPVVSTTTSGKITRGLTTIELIEGTDYTVNTAGLVQLNTPLIAADKLEFSYYYGGGSTFNTAVIPVAIGSTSGIITRNVTTVDDDGVETTESQIIQLVEGTDYTVNISGLVQLNTPLITLDQFEFSYDYLVDTPQIVDGTALASSYQVLFSALGGVFANMAFSFYDALNTFTITSGSGGPSSSAVVLTATLNDIQTLMGFDVQKQQIGKYKNNLLNVQIDGTAAQIEIADFRLCANDPALGDSNDELGVYWSTPGIELGYMGRTKVGPLLCSGINNGNEVAESIQAKLREVGSGGFKDVICYYFDDDQTFIIYSGSFGTGSSVHILPASDPLRDARTLLGFNPFQEERGNEQFYGYLGELYAQLDTYPQITVSGLTTSSRLSHSIIYIPPNGVKIAADWQDLIVATSKIYDDGSRGLPRLYLDGKIVIDDTNDKINFFESNNVEKTATLTHGAFSEGEVAKLIAQALSAAGSSVYTSEYDTILKKFYIKSDGVGGGGIFSLLFGSGRDALKSIAIFIGFNTVDKSGSLTYWSDIQLKFSQDNFFYPIFCPQFYGVPLLTDDTVDEQSAILKEEEYLNSENNILLNSMRNITAYDNEVQIENWEYLANLELSKVVQEYNAVRIQRGFYSSHISESDAEVTRKTDELNSLIPNRTNLIDLTSAHGKILDLASEQKTFVSGVDFTNEGSQSLPISVTPGIYDKRIYNNPAPFVRFVANPSKQIPGQWSPSGLFNSSILFSPEQLTAFRLANTRTGTKGYSYSQQDLDRQYSIIRGSDTPATMLAANTGTFDLSAGDTVKIKVDGTAEQTAIIDATAGYVESRIGTMDGFVIKTGVNDKIDFSEGDAAATIYNTINQTYLLDDGDQLGISVNGDPIQYATFNATAGYVSSTADVETAFPIKTGTNDKIDFKEMDGTQLTATLSAGNYTAQTLATEIQNKLNTTGKSVYSVAYNTGSKKFSIISNGNLKIESGISDRIDFSEVQGIQLTANISAASYTPAALAAEIQSKLNTAGKSTYTVTYSLSRFNILSDGKIRISTGINDRIDFEEVEGIQITATLNSGDYTPAALTTEIKTRMEAAGTKVYTITYFGNKFTITCNVNFVITASNNKLDFEETVGVQKTATIPVGTYTAATLATAIQTQMGLAGSNTYLVTFAANKFTIAATSASYTVVTGTNDAVDFSEVDGTDLSAFASAGTYSGASLATEIQNKLNLSGKSGYTVSFSAGQFTLTSDGKFKVVTGTNNKLDFSEDGITTLTATLTAGTYTGSGLATEIQTRMNAVGASTYTVSFSGNKFTITSTGGLYTITAGVDDAIDFKEVDNPSVGEFNAYVPAGSYSAVQLATAIQNQLNSNGNSAYTVTYSSNKFTISSDGAIKIQSGINDAIDFSEDGINEKSAFLTAGTYTPSALATEIKAKMQAAGTKTYTVTYSANKFTIATTGTLELWFLSGTNGGQTVCDAIGFDGGFDKTGASSYTAEYSSGIFSILWNTGANVGFTVGPTIGFAVAADDTGSLSYLADNTSTVPIKLLWNSGVNKPTSIGWSIGYNMTADDTGGVSYLADYDSGIFKLLWNSGTYGATDIGNLIGFNNVDKIGSLSYTSDNITSGYLKLRWNTGSNSAQTIGTIIGFNITSDDSGFTSYTADYKTAIFNLLWNTGTNFARSVGSSIGYNVGSDDTGNVTYLADYDSGIFNLLWSSGTNNGRTTGSTIGFSILSDDTGLISYTADYASGILSILWNTGSNALISVSTTIGYNNVTDDTGAFLYIGDFAREFVILTSVNDRFNITINGIVNTSPITIVQGYYSGLTLASEMQTEITADPSFGIGYCIVGYSTKRFAIASSRKGTSSSLLVSSVIGRDFLPVVNLIGSSPVAGTGDFSDISQATAAEVVFVLNTDWSSIIASVYLLTKIKVITNLLGNQTLQIFDGTGFPNIQLGFPTSMVVGQGDFTATLTAGAYIGTALALELQTQMNAIGNSNYTVDYDVSATNKFTFVSDGFGGTGEFRLYCATGVSIGQSVWFTIGFNAVDKIGSLTYSSDNQTEYSIITNVNDRFRLKLKTINCANDIIISQGNYLALSLVSEMATQIANDPNFNSGMFTVTYPANRFRVTSTTKGTSSLVDIYEGATNDFLRTVALDGDIPIVGGGDVSDIDAVTVNEVVSVLNAEISGISASNDTNKVRITTLSAKGTVSSLEVTGGTASVIIGFTIGLIERGLDKMSRLKIDINSDATQTPLELNTSPSFIPASTVRADIQAKLQAKGVGGYIGALCTFGEITAFFDFTNRLRILSGTYGASSYVNVNNNTIIIQASNNKIDFEETIGIQLTATLTNGFYNGNSLAAEIQTKLNSVGTPATYTVTYSSITKKMTLSSSGTIFRLLFASGTNAGSSVCNTIGMYNINYIGALSYVSDGLVKIDNVVDELGYNPQTIEPGHGVIDVLTSMDDSHFTVDLILDTGGGTRREFDIDITVAPNNMIAGLLNTINTYAFGGTELNFYSCQFDYAYLLGRVSGDFRISDGDTLVVNANGAGNQTITFSAVRATSTSGSIPYTRVYSGVNDRLKINIDNIGVSEVGVSNEGLSGGVGDKDFDVNNAPIKPGSTSITLMRLLPPLFIPMPVTLNENTDYTVNYSSGHIHLNDGLWLGDFNIKIDYTYYSGISEIVLGTQLTPEKIVAKIQQEVRNIYNSNIEKYAGYLGFTCEYVGGRYVLKSGTGGTGSYIKVFDGSSASAAPGLKLGTDYGGVETAGSGDCVNSCFATVSEMISKINTSASGFSASGTNYIKLTSTVFGNSTRLQVSGSLLTKFGFDNNNDNYPSSNLASVDCTTVKNFTNVSIKNPIVYTVLRGWETQKGNVLVDYAVTDDSRLVERQGIIPPRLSYIPVRKPQIPVRAAAVTASLTPVLYQARRNAVTIRLNKKTGSYVRVGDEFGAKENMQDTIDTNNAQIGVINSLL